MTNPLLDTIHTPDDLRALAPAELPKLATELRAFLVDSVAHTGGHLFHSRLEWIAVEECSGEIVTIFAPRYFASQR